VFDRIALGLVLLIMVPATLAQQQINIDGQTYRDPTQPVGMTVRAGQVQGQGPAAVSGRRTYTVTFIRAGASNSVAVINGQVVGNGDTVDGALVRAIETDKVLLSVEGQTLEVSTFRPTFRSPSQ
jgi:hypothetical protein